MRTFKPAAFLRSLLRNVDPGVWAILLIFLALTVTRRGVVPIWDSRIYYDGCLMPALRDPPELFDLLKLNCFGHPTMLYMILLAPGQWLSPGNVLLLYLPNVLLGCLSIIAFSVLTTILLPGEAWRRERLLATSIFAVWPAAVASCLNVTPDYAVLAFFVVFLALLLKDRLELAAVAGMFLVFSKEFGAILYGAAVAILVVLSQLWLRDRTVRERWHDLWRKKKILAAPVVLYFLVSVFALTRPSPAVWGGASVLSRVLKRFVFFNPAEFLLGPFGPTIWLLSFSWILTGVLFIALFRLLISSRARGALRSAPAPKKILLCVPLFFAAAVYGLTRYETFANPRYFLAIVPLFILTSLLALQVALPNSLLRQAVLAVTFLLLLASNFRTLDPVSRAVWGTFPFGRHELLRLTSWTNECCGYSRDQLVYNLEYLKIPELQDSLFADIRPGPGKTFAAHPQADWFLGGRVDAQGKRSLKLEDTVRMRYFGPDFLESRRSQPQRVYYVAFPNFDDGPEFQRLRRHYEATATKLYELSGYSITVYAMKRK